MWSPSISVFERATADGGGPCLGDEARRWSNAEVAARVEAAAACLGALGVGRGDVVAVMMTNRLEIAPRT
jgi:acyl-CoA synthetase (AMP-forming)/AMP-acid ligase II